MSHRVFLSLVAAIPASISACRSSRAFAARFRGALGGAFFFALLYDDAMLAGVEPCLIQRIEEATCLWQIIRFDRGLRLVDHGLRIFLEVLDHGIAPGLDFLLLRRLLLCLFGLFAFAHARANLSDATTGEHRDKQRGAPDGGHAGLLFVWLLRRWRSDEVVAAMRARWSLGADRLFAFRAREERHDKTSRSIRARFGERAL